MLALSGRDGSLSTQRERAPGAGPVLSQNQSATDADRRTKGTPALARLTWNGHAGLTPEYARRVGWDGPAWAHRLRDTEAGALEVFDAIGRHHARALALELLRLCEEVRR